LSNVKYADVAELADALASGGEFNGTVSVFIEPTEELESA